MRNTSIYTSIFFSGLLLLTGCGKVDPVEQIIIPDENFLSALIEKRIDEDRDGQISYSEAEYVFTLDLAEREITDLTGIEAFVNLTKLDCWKNNLTSLDVSHNTQLEILYCDENQLSSLDLSKNLVLEILECGNNQLANLDLSVNTFLTWIGISGMPSLHEVCVWTMPFPPAEVQVLTSDSPNVNFTTGCSK